MIVELLALIALLGISAYFSACETAMTGASRARIYALSAQGNRRALRVEIPQQRAAPGRGRR